MKLILTRHGETDYNKKQLLQGQKESVLTQLGINQAEKLSNRLKTENIDIIYTSDLIRALHTAEIVAKYHKVKIIQAKELRERDVGPYAGTKVGTMDFDNPPANVETYEQMIIRSKTILDKIYQKHKNNTVLIVAHGGINKALTSVILNKPVTELQLQSNTSITIFKLREDNQHEVHLMDCVKHLG